MTKPHEEMWVHTSGAWPYDVSRAVTGEKIADVWATGQEDGNGTADLIAQAPAMARLLLEMQWSGSPDGFVSGCPLCDAPWVAGDGAHLPDCALVAVLRAAGVLT